MKNSNQDSSPLFEAVPLLVGGFVFFKFLGIVLVFIGKVFTVFITYFAFFIAPFGLGTLLSAFTMEFVSGFETLDYRKSVFAIAALCLISLIFMNGFQPKEREVVTILSKKKQEVTIKRLVTNPTIFQSFESLRKRADNVGEVLLPKFYDLQNLVFIFSLGILLGGPSLFWIKSKKQKEEEENRIRKEIALPFETEIEESEKTLRNVKGRNYDLIQEVKELTAEIERLKSRDQYLTKNEKDPSEPTGLLDSNEI